MSGVSNIGHDIGGFSGPAPDAELFVRWVQFGILMPRFSIHSWNDDGTVNEPWMHPEVTQHVAGSDQAALPADALSVPVCFGSRASATSRCCGPPSRSFHKTRNATTTVTT